MKKKKSNKTTILVCIFVSLAIIGICLGIFGAVRIFNRDLVYDEAIIACDDKDYSSYIKKTEVQTPGNEYINSQIEIYKRAIDRAREAGDSYSVGKLMEEYNQLLQTQAQTKTTETKYDYSEVDKAKQKCYSLADKQKESSFIVGSVLFIVGGVLFIAGSITALVIGLKPKRH
jgi:hypothetical protein